MFLENFSFYIVFNQWFHALKFKFWWSKMQKKTVSIILQSKNFKTSFPFWLFKKKLELVLQQQQQQNIWDLN